MTRLLDALTYHLDRFIDRFLLGDARRLPAYAPWGEPPRPFRSPDAGEAPPTPAPGRSHI